MDYAEKLMNLAMYIFGGLLGIALIILGIAGVVLAIKLMLAAIGV